MLAFAIIIAQQMREVARASYQGAVCQGAD
jgi:hypothetical protein